MKLDTRRRYAFIESRLYWGEGLTAKALAEVFGLSRQSAQAVIEQYRQCYPDHMVYDARKKQHRADENFETHYIRTDALSYLDAMRGQKLIGHYVEDVGWSDVPFEDVSRCLKQKMASLSAVFDGLIKQEEVSIYYTSKYSMVLRCISPHHVVYADGRYHVRAYCHLKEKFLDFVLSRIRNSTFAGKDWVSGEHDRDWREHTTLKFQLNPALDESTKQAIREDYEFQQDLLTISCRKAVRLYVERQMFQVDQKSHREIWLKIAEGET